LALCSKCDEAHNEITSESEIDINELNAEELTPVESKVLAKLLNDNCSCRIKVAVLDNIVPDLKQPDKYRLSASESPLPLLTTSSLK